MPWEAWGSSLQRFLSLTGFSSLTWGSGAMIAIGALLLYLAIRKGFEPFLLLPIGAGVILSNLPAGGMFEEGGLLYYFYLGVKNGVLPSLIFMGIGALTDFGPLLSNPKTILLGAAAQFAIFGAFLASLAFGFSLAEASTIGMIGGADGPTVIYLASKLAPHLLGPVAVAAYCYMALIPVIQPPIIRLFTTQAERRIIMAQPPSISKPVRVLFPVVTTIFTGLVVPAATPLVGMLMLGNLFRECGVVSRLLKTTENALLNLVTILLGTSIGASMTADLFLNPQTLFILLLGLLALSIGIASGILFAKVMNVFGRDKINPIIGSAGVSAVPMAARVCQKVGQEANPNNFLLMHAMGPNLAGQIGSPLVAGILLALLGS